eukprot:g576.t1
MKKGGVRVLLKIVESFIEVKDLLLSQTATNALSIFQSLCACSNEKELNSFRQTGAQSIFKKFLGELVRLSKLEREQNEKLCIQIISFLCTEEDVSDLCVKLKELVTAEKPNYAKITETVEALLHVTNDKKFAGLIAELEGGECLVSILSTLAEIDEPSPEQEQCKELVEKALCGICANAEISEEVHAVPWLMYVLGKDQDPVTLRALSNIASSSHIDALIDNNCVQVVIDLFKESFDDGAMVTNCLEILSILSKDERALENLRNEKFDVPIISWMRDYLGDADSESVLHALSILASMIVDEEIAEEFLDEMHMVPLELCLTKFCVSDIATKDKISIKNATRCMDHVIDIFDKITSTYNGSADDLIDFHALGNLSRVILANPEIYASNEDSMLKLCKFMEILNQGEEQDALNAQGLLELAKLLKSKFPSNTQIQNICNQILGIEPEEKVTPKLCLDEMALLVSNISASEANLDDEEEKRRLELTLTKCIQCCSSEINDMAAEDTLRLGTIGISSIRVILDNRAFSDSEKEDLLMMSMTAITLSLTTDNIDSLDSPQLDAAISGLMSLVTEAESKKVRIKALETITSLSKSAKVTQHLMELGALTMLKGLAADTATDDEGAKYAQDAVEQILENAVSFTGDLTLMGGIGSQITSAIVSMQDADAEHYSDMVDDFAEKAGGTALLLDLLEHETVDKPKDDEDNNADQVTFAQKTKIIEAVTKTMKDDEGKEDVAKRLDVVSKVLANTTTILTDKNATKQMTVKETEDLNKCADACISALEDVIDHGHADDIVESKGMEVLVSLIENGTDHNAAQAVDVLAKIVEESKQSKYLMKRLEDLGLLAKITNAMNKRTMSKRFNDDAIQLLQLLQVEDEEDFAIDGAQLHIIKKSAKKHGLDVDNLIDSLAKAVTSKGPDEIPKLIKAGLEALDVIAVTELQTEEGQIYYVDNKTNESSWDPPNEVTIFQNKFSEAKALCNEHKDHTEVMEDPLIILYQNVLNRYFVNPTMLHTLLDLLVMLSRHRIQQQAIIIAAGTDLCNTVLHILRIYKHGSRIAKLCLRVLEFLSRDRGIRQSLANATNADALQTIIDMYDQHIDDVDMVKICTSCLAQMTYQNSNVTTKLVELGAIKRLEKCLQKYIDDESVLEMLYILLSNMMLDSDKVKRDVGLICGDEISLTIHNHLDNVKVIIAALRCLGNLAFADANISWIVKNKAVEYIVEAINYHRDHIPLCKTALDVLSNLAALKSNDDVDESTEAEEDYIYELFCDHGGMTIAFKIIRDAENLKLMSSAVDILEGLTFDENSTIKMHRHNVVELLLNMIVRFQVETDFVQKSTNVLANLTESPECAISFIKNHGISTSVEVMNTVFDDDIEIVLNLVSAITNTVKLQAEGKSQFVDEGGPVIIADLLAQKGVTTESIIQGLQLLIACSCDTKNLANIGDACLSKIISIAGIAKSGDSSSGEELYTAEVQENAIQLISLLCIDEENLQKIVQHDGIACVVDAAITNAADQKLIKYCLECIESIAMADQTYAALIAIEGGKDVVKEVKDIWKLDDTEIADTCDGILICIDQAEIDLKAKAQQDRALIKKRQQDVSILSGLTQKIADQMNFEGSESQASSKRVEMDIDTMYEVLTSGKVLKINKGSLTSKKRLFFFTNDLSMFKWKHVGAAKAQKSVFLRDIMNITCETSPKFMVHVYTKNGPRKKGLAVPQVSMKCPDEITFMTWHSALTLLLKLWRVDSPQLHKYMN